MELTEIAIFATTIISLIALFRSIWDKRFDKIDANLHELRRDMSEVKERLAFIEATTLRFEIPENVSPRSTAAKRVWQKRKDRELENRATE
jgi:hypothetical protein